MAEFDIFIAYAGADAGTARELYTLLSKRCDAFLDSASITLGDDWDLALSRAQKQSRISVVLISENTGRAYYEREEIQTAISMARNTPGSHRVVPIIIRGDVEIPYGLRTKHGLSLEHTTLQEVADRLVDLSARLKQVPAPDPDDRVRDHYRADALFAHATATPVDDRPRGSVAVAGTRVDPLVTFVDRLSERRTLRNWLSDDLIRCVSVVGRGGIGKTALAAKVMRELEDEARTQPESAFKAFVSISSRTRTREITTERIYLDCSQLFGAEGKELEQLWRSPVYTLEQKFEGLTDRLSRARALILLDNFEDALKAGSIADAQLVALIDQFVSASDGPTLLVTTRELFGLTPRLEPRRRELDLGSTLGLSDGGLPSEDAMVMFRQLDLDGRAGLRDADEASLRALAQAAGGVPRAIEILAGQERATRLWGVGGAQADHGIALATLIEDEHSRLDPSAQHVLEIVAGFGRPVDLAAIDYVVTAMGETVDTRVQVELLLRRRLIKKTSEREFATHATDAEHAWRRVPETGRWSKPALDHSLAGYWASLALPVREIHEISALEPQLLQYRHLVRAGDYEAAAAVVCECADFLVWRQGSVTRARQMLAEMEDQVQDGGLRVRLAITSAAIFYFLGPVKDGVSRLEWAVDEARQRGLRDYEAQALNLLGDIYRTLGDTEKSVELLRQAVDAEVSAESELGLQSLLHLGLAYLYGGRREEALGALEELSRLADSSTNPLCKAQCANLRSAVAAVEERWAECADLALEAQRLYELAGMDYAIAYVLNTAGLALLMLGNPAAASSHLRLGGEKSRASEDIRAQALNLHNLAFALRAAGDTAEARAAAAASERLLRLRDPLATLARDVLAALDAEIRADWPAAAASYRQAATETGLNADLFPAVELRRIADDLESRIR